MNKKGNLLDVFMWIIISFVILIFFAMWIFGFNIMTDIMTNLDSTAPGLNISQHAQATFGQVNNALEELKWIAFILIIGQALSIFLFNIFTREHPVMFVPYVLVNIIAVIFSVIISNTYENLLTNSAIGETLMGFKAGTFIMLNLPYMATIVGFLGAVFLVIGLARERSTIM